MKFEIYPINFGMFDFVGKTTPTFRIIQLNEENQDLIVDIAETCNLKNALKWADEISSDQTFIVDKKEYSRKDLTKALNAFKDSKIKEEQEFWDEE